MPAERLCAQDATKTSAPSDHHPTNGRSERLPHAHICAEPGCRALLPSAGRCQTHTRQRRQARQARPIERIYDSPRWRNHTRPAVFERDGHRCVHCHQPGTADDPLTVAHIRRTTELLAEGHDVYDEDWCVTAHRSCHASNAPRSRGGIPSNADPDDRPVAADFSCAQVRAEAA